MNYLFTLLGVIFGLGCQSKMSELTTKSILSDKSISLVVLGTVQDGGSPHIACEKACCKDLFEHPDPNRQVVSMGIIDPFQKKKYILDASPDFPRQMKALYRLAPFSKAQTPDGIFLTHAHIGHYTGLMYLGKEAMNAKETPVYAMPRMKSFLEENGPWNQLVNTHNISIKPIEKDKPIILSPNLQIIPFRVPHRDEYSETEGYKIIGKSKSAIFIPDIDKWEKWCSSIINEISKVDYAFLDATFYDGEEINNRDISQIPHPFMIESMKKFQHLPKKEKDKIYFIHFNHTNPVLNLESKKAKIIMKNGFHLAQIKQIFEL